MTKTMCTFAVLCAVVLSAACVVFWTKSGRPRHELIVEFTYSAAKPGNTNHCANGDSIRFLRDLFMCWGGEVRTTQPSFGENLKVRFKGFPEIAALHLSDEDVDRLCRGVEFSLVADGIKSAHSIPCRMTVRGDSEMIVRSLARAFREEILHENEQENRIRAGKATKAVLDKGRIVKKRVCELESLRNQLAVPGKDANETARLNVAISMAEKAVRKAKAEWDAEIKVCRSELDRTINFRDDSH